MNGIFFIICFISIIICLISCPEKVLPAMLNGANKSLVLIFNLASIYAVWLAVYKLLDLAGLSDFFAKLLIKPVKKLFNCEDKKTCKIISLNLASNMLGLGGIATPLGIKACANLEKQNNLRGAKLLVIISATSVQLLSTSVISLLTAYGSQSAQKIIIPSLICTIFSTTLGIFLFFFVDKLKKLVNNKSKKQNISYTKTAVKRGAKI